MAFKIYKNKVTGHSSVSIKQNDKKRWHNLPMSHKKPNDSFIEIQDPHPKAKSGDKSYVRKYVRKDKKGVKGFQYLNYVIKNEDEVKIKRYVKEKYKKR